MADGSSCGSNIILYPPSGDPFEFPVDDIYNDTTPDEEVWDEVSRETSNIDVRGVQIERIDSVTFSRGSGKIIKLNFNN